MNDKKQTVWVLTSEVNAYDQAGEYFVKVFAKKPELEQLIDATKGTAPSSNVQELLKFLLHLQKGGGRMGTEDTWFHLREVAAE